MRQHLPQSVYSYCAALPFYLIGTIRHFHHIIFNINKRQGFHALRPRVTLPLSLCPIITSPFADHTFLPPPTIASHHHRHNSATLSTAAQLPIASAFSGGSVTRLYIQAWGSLSSHTTTLQYADSATRPLSLSVCMDDSNRAADGMRLPTSTGALGENDIEMQRVGVKSHHQLTALNTC